jgi:hypothetical protein
MLLNLNRPLPFPSTSVEQSGNGGKRRHVRSQIRNGQRRAVLQAVTAARAYLAKLPWAPTIAIAARGCGSTPAYVAAAIVILRSNDDHALWLVLRGSWSLLETAARLRPRVKLLDAFNRASASDRAFLGQAAGVSTIWDAVIMPAL